VSIQERFARRGRVRGFARRWRLAWFRYVYQNAFQYFRMGYASAEAVALTFIVLGFTWIQFRFGRSEEHA
jgi:ABC-type sugar transport system permease subunit